MRKTSTLIALLVTVVFLLGIAIPAFAAGNDVPTLATQKLMGLGIVEGDPDGNLRLGDTITRAEFSKVAVMAAGMGNAADMLKSSPTKFSDVKVNEWYTGWINVASSQGFVKGYPDGSFRPNNPISGQEVVTVLLRLLGYNDNLPGQWPADYIAKAVVLGITDDVSFNAAAPAVRGDVFTMTSATLEEKYVSYDKDTEEFIENKDGKKLLDKSFESKLKEGVVELVKMKKNDVQVVINGEDFYKTYTVADEYFIGGANEVFGAEDKWAEFILNEDDEVTYLGLTDLDVVEVEVDKYDDNSYNFTKGNNNNSVKFDGKKYDIAAGDTDKDTFTVVCYDNFIDAAAFDNESAFETWVTGLDTLYLVLNEDGDVVAFKGFEWPVGVVDEDGVTVKNDNLTLRLRYNSGIGDISSRINIDTESDSYLVVKDGKCIDFEDIQENDVVAYFENTKGVDKFLMVTDETVEGKLTRIGKGWEPYIDGNEIEATAYIEWVDTDYDRENDPTKMIGEPAKVLLNFDGRALYVIGNPEDSASGFYAVLRGITEVQGAGGKTYYLNLFTKSGEANYQITKDTKYTVDTWNAEKQKPEDVITANKLKLGDILEIKLTDDGKVKNVEFKAEYPAAPVVLNGNVDKDNDRIGNRKVTDSSIIVALDGGANIGTTNYANTIDFEAANWAQVEDMYDATDVAYYAFVDGAYVDVLVVYSTTFKETDDYLGAAIANVGILDDYAFGADDLEFRFMTADGEFEWFDCDGVDLSDVGGAAAVDGTQFMEYKLNEDGKIKEVVLANNWKKDTAGVVGGVNEIIDEVLTTEKVDKTTSITVSYNAGADEEVYFFDDDVVVFDVTGDDPEVVRVNDIRKDDKVMLFFNDDDNVEFVVIY